MKKHDLPDINKISNKIDKIFGNFRDSRLYGKVGLSEKNVSQHKFYFSSKKIENDRSAT